VIDVIHELESYGARVHIHDPVADAAEARHEYGVALTPWDQLPKAKAVVLAVAHKEFVDRPTQQISGLLKPGGVLIDVKCAADPQAYRAAGIDVWRL
jgi:UDP-N-acetyl-D-galactosamine dehydrogenase